MSTSLKAITALSIVAVAITSALAYSIHYGLTSAFIVLPTESVRMLLVPIPPMVE